MNQQRTSHPSDLVTAAITGTNGKTTTTSMLASIVAASGETSARVTTLGAWVGDEHVTSEATSEGFSLAVDCARQRGVKTLAVETTSEALAAGFARAWPVKVGVFTNLSRDHLDAHGSPEGYLAAKAQLFMHLLPHGTAVLHAADPVSALLDEVIPPEVSRVAYAARAIDPACSGLHLALSAREVSVSREGTRVLLAPSPLANALAGEIRLLVVGAVNAENALAAALAADVLGYSADAIATGLANFAGVPGRFEIISRNPLIVVDFAHTPDALERTLTLARQIVAERGGAVHVVFGCGGDRDPGKRFEMGRIASSLSDQLVLTTDNPRTEDASVIANQVAEGFAGGRALARKIPDRAQAIHEAIVRMMPADIVVIAGKGHEKVQIIGGNELPFDDAQVARSAIARR